MDRVCPAAYVLLMYLKFPSFEHLSSLPEATKVLDRFYWNLSVEQKDGEIWLRGGEVLIGRFASMGELETFTAGMALALSVLPEEVATLIDLLVGE